MTAKSPGNHRRLVTLLLNGIAKEESKAVWSYLNFVVRTCLLLLSESCCYCMVYSLSRSIHHHQCYIDNETHSYSYKSTSVSWCLFHS